MKAKSEDEDFLDVNECGSLQDSSQRDEEDPLPVLLLLSPSATSLTVAGE